MILFYITGAAALLSLALAAVCDWRFAVHLAGFYAGLAAAIVGTVGAFLAGFPELALLAMFPGFGIAQLSGRAMERRAAHG